jgi:hypothetical protein
VRRPQALVLDEHAKSIDERVCLFVLTFEHLLVRIDVLLHERPYPSPEREHVVRRAEIGDRHAFSIAGMALRDQTR